MRAADPVRPATRKMSYRKRFQASDLLGVDVGEWRFERVLGEGGMSVVYAASHLSGGDERAAIKLLLPSFYSDATVLQRFEREAKALKALRHPNVIEIKDFREDEDLGYYMVLALLEGQDLYDLIKGFAPLPLSWVLPVMGQICEGLMAVHEAGIIHRDLKPSNIFLSPADPIPCARILDFGIAKVQLNKEDRRITTTGTIVGTPAYLAPEQVITRGEIVPATDIYALGVLLFEMLTGKLPFDGGSSYDHVFMVVQEEAPLLGSHRPCFAATSLEKLIAQTLAKNAEERPQTTQDFWEQLGQACDGLEDPRDLPTYRPTITVQEPIIPKSSRPETMERVQYAIEGDKVYALDGAGEEEDEGFLSTLEAPAELYNTPAGQAAQESPPTGEPMNKGQGTQDMPSPLMKPLSGDGLPTSTSSSHPHLPNPSDEHGTVSESQALALPPDTLALKRSTLQWGLALLCGVGLVVGVVAGAFVWSPPIEQPIKRTPDPRSSQRPVVTRRPQAPQDSVGRWLSRGDIALAKGDTRQALRLWRKAHLLPAWSSHAKWWEHTQTLVSRYRRLGHLASADAVWRQALAKATLTDEQKASANQARQAIQTKLSLRSKALKRLRGQFLRHIKQQQWVLAQLKYKQLRKESPSGVAWRLLVARLIGPSFPGLQKMLAQEVLSMLVPSEAEQTQARVLVSSATKEIAKLQRLAKRALEAIAKKRSLLQRARRLSRYLGTSDVLVHPCGQRVVLSWLKAQWKQAPTKAMLLWTPYNKAQRRLQQRDKWLWLKLQLPEVMTNARLIQQTGAIRLYQRAMRFFATAQAAMTRAQLTPALRAYKSFQSLWSQLLAQDLLQVTRGHDTEVTEASRWVEKLPPLVLLVKKIYQAMRAGQTQQVSQLKKEFLEQLGAHPAKASFVKKFATANKREQARRRLLSQAELAYKTKRWALARKHYRLYAKRFPHAGDGASIKKRLKACRCAMGLFPFEICKPADFPAHHPSYRK